MQFQELWDWQSSHVVQNELVCPAACIQTPGLDPILAVLTVTGGCVLLWGGIVGALDRQGAL